MGGDYDFEDDPLYILKDFLDKMRYKNIGEFAVSDWQQERIIELRDDGWGDSEIAVAMHLTVEEVSRDNIPLSRKQWLRREIKDFMENFND